MPRFFVPPSAVADGRAVITGEDARHIARSLRMAAGETVTVCDGAGREYECRLDVIRDETVACTVVSERLSASEPPYRATVFQALVKGDRFETAVQKSVEYGAYGIVPFECSRCIVRASRDRSSRDARYSRIALEAAKQCGRSIVPAVRGAVSFSRMLDEAADADLAVFCYENEKKTLLPAALPDRIPERVSIVIGPEGGFSPEEAEEASRKGLVPVGLGERILRTESAAPFVLAVLSAKYELSPDRMTTI